MSGPEKVGIIILYIHIIIISNPIRTEGRQKQRQRQNEIMTLRISD